MLDNCVGYEPIEALHYTACKKDIKGSIHFQQDEIIDCRNGMLNGCRSPTLYLNKNPLYNDLSRSVENKWDNLTIYCVDIRT
jgi:hypothetical protein